MLFGLFGFGIVVLGGVNERLFVRLIVRSWPVGTVITTGDHIPTMAALFNAAQLALEAARVKAPLMGIPPVQPAAVRVRVVAVLLRTVPDEVPAVTVLPAYALIGIARLVSEAPVAVKVVVAADEVTAVTAAPQL
jgi:hypothetical protein